MGPAGERPSGVLSSVPGGRVLSREILSWPWDANAATVIQFGASRLSVENSTGGLGQRRFWKHTQVPRRKRGRHCEQVVLRCGDGNFWKVVLNLDLVPSHGAPGRFLIPPALPVSRDPRRAVPRPGALLQPASSCKHLSVSAARARFPGCVLEMSGSSQSLLCSVCLGRPPALVFNWAGLLKLPSALFSRLSWGAPCWVPAASCAMEMEPCAGGRGLPSAPCSKRHRHFVTFQRESCSLQMFSNPF